MTIYETFFQRQKKLRGEVPDVFFYDALPDPLRVQIVQIMMESLGEPEHYFSEYGHGPRIQRAYKDIVQILRRELGVFQLPYRTSRGENYLEELAQFIIHESNAELALSAIELVCRGIEFYSSRYEYRNVDDAEEKAKAAVEEINARMKSQGVGYEYAGGNIVRIDAELVHAEAVKPALALLRNKIYAGAEQEFRSAFEHYRKGKNKEALADALKTIESTMKIICTKRKWAFAQTDTAKKLIDICLDKGLIPTYWQTHFASLRSMLESSVPTARNKTSGHGQGTVIQSVPDHLASYVLHMTASTIVFLVKAEQALP